MGVSTIHIIGDSNLVIGQISGEYRCKSWELAPFNSIALELLREFDDVRVQHVQRAYNMEADKLAQIGSGTRMDPMDDEKFIRVQRRILPSVKQREMAAEVFSINGGR